MRYRHVLRRGRSIKLPVNGELVYIDIDEDIDLNHRDEGPLKVRCEGPDGLKTGSVVGMLQQLGLSGEEILRLRQEGVLQLIDFNNIGAPWEPFDRASYDEEPEEPDEPASSSAEPTNPSIAEELSQPLEAVMEELANYDQRPPEKTLEVLERVKRRLEWEALKEQSREEIAWFLDNLAKANTAPRCAHIKPDGSTCGSPAVKDDSFCHWHSETRALRRARKPAEELELPVLEDRFGLQLGIMRVCDLLTNKTIDPYTARVLFQGLRLAERTLNKRNALPRKQGPCKTAEEPAKTEPHEQTR